MGLSIYNLKKWYKMIRGKSILHVNQGVGKFYKKNAIEGYYNDLREKILKNSLEDSELPIYTYEDGEKRYFSIEIFQYGLAAYDLYIETKNEKYIKIFKKTVDWAISNQSNNGGWSSFEKQFPKNPYSSMAQGEGVSLLCRAYIAFKDEKYLNNIKNAIYFMIKPIDEGGVSLYLDNYVFLKEFVEAPVVLNGWIFSIFGLYDYLMLFPDDETIKEYYKKTISTLKDNIEKFDMKYWSKYDIESKVASPFYHRLHISLLYTLYDLTEIELFKEYSEKFRKYEENKFYKLVAFIKKASQKIKEK